ncbi:MAG: hypothetical protein AAFR84_02210 [Pseudomonadota bacterium]
MAASDAFDDMTGAGKTAPAASSSAELVGGCLENEGVAHIFGISGKENTELTDALIGDPISPLSGE